MRATQQFKRGDLSAAPRAQLLSVVLVGVPSLVPGSLGTARAGSPPTAGQQWAAAERTLAGYNVAGSPKDVLDVLGATVTSKAT